MKKNISRTLNFAESILHELGIPKIWLMETLYRQIVIHKGVLFPITLAQKPSEKR